MSKLIDFFNPIYGNRDYTDKSSLDKGESLLVSSQGIDNGVYGFFDIPVKYTPPIITVPRTGSIGYAFVQHTICNITDDCIILFPKDKYPIEYFYYIATVIRRTKWRYNYGRKITPKRISSIPVSSASNFKSKSYYSKLFSKYYPLKNKKQIKKGKVNKFKEINITELFDIKRGHFHAIDKLTTGIYPTISRVSFDNGLVGFYNKPKNATKFIEPLITISTVTGDAFLQMHPFIATDNVLICKSLIDLKITSLIYIQALINRVKWRYSYGRQPYKRIFQKATISMPIDDNNNIDEDYMESIVKSQQHWDHFESNFCK